MLANVANEAGDQEKARQLFTESVATVRALGDENYALNASSSLAYEHLDDAAFAAAWERGQSLTVDEAVAQALEIQAT